MLKDALEVRESVDDLVVPNRQIRWGQEAEPSVQVMENGVAVGRQSRSRRSAPCLLDPR